MTPEPLGSPLPGPPRGERADAVRNRAAILAAATELLATTPGEVSMQDVADRAGLGVGTLYRRFGDRRGLLLAVLDEGERDFQRRFMTGPAPLGPGPGHAVDPEQRVLAFEHAMLDRTLDTLALRLALDPRGDRDPGPRDTWHLHLRLLCHGLGPDRVPDPHYWADLLLGACDPSLLHDQLERGATREGLHRALDTSVRRLLATRAAEGVSDPR